MAGVGAGAPFLRHEHLGLPCPKMLERAGTFALKRGPGLAEKWAFSGLGPKVLVQAKSEWALASGHWPKSSSQAWVRKSIASVLSEAGAPLPKTGGGNFSGDEEAEEEGKVPTLPSARAGATSSSLSFLASSSWEGSTMEMQGSSSHHSCKAKQEEPTTTCNELGCYQSLVSTRTLAHLRFRRSAVFSSTATNLPQESPNLLKRFLLQRCKGRPQILTHTRRAPPPPPSRHPTEGFHLSRQKLLPLKRLTPNLDTLSTSSANSNSRSKRRQGQGGGQCIPPIYPQDTCPTTPPFYQGPLSQFLTKQHHEAWSNPEELLCLFPVDHFFPHFC